MAASDTPTPRGSDQHPPTAVTLYWCPRCGSLFRYDVGTGHVPHTPPFFKCETKLVPKPYFH